MKRYTPVLLVVFLTLIGACTKENDIKKYSCDPEIDKWVKSELNYVNSLTFNQIIREPRERQLALFNAVTPKKRLDLWQNKLNNVLALRWRIEERRHIELLLGYLNEEHFSDPDRIDVIKSQNRLKEFLKTWIYYSKNQFNWSDGLLFSILHRLDTPHSDDKLIESGNLSDDPIGGTSANKCKCSTGDDWCNAFGGPGGECKQNYQNCDETTWGCGTLFIYKCDGKCVLYVGIGK